LNTGLSARTSFDILGDLVKVSRHATEDFS
jgi:hypothetical protein